MEQEDYWRGKVNAGKKKTLHSRRTMALGLAV